MQNSFAKSLGDALTDVWKKKWTLVPFRESNFIIFWLT